MTVLVFGKTGQVATELARAGGDVVCLGRDAADLSDPEACAEIIRETEATGVINAAAYTAVDKAEDEEALATVINGDAPAAMARAAAARGLPFVHISTDYVFDGSGTDPWRPEDATAPLGAYGRSKLAGERGVVAAGGAFAILRTSWVFSAHGNNFVKTMLRLAETRDHLTIVEDQVGGPTEAGDIARACLAVVRGLGGAAGPGGIHHFSGRPDVSWADFAREIFAQADRGVTVEGIPSSAYPTKAKRPGNSRMDCSSLEDMFGVARPDWREGLLRVLADLSA
ncbi:MAG: dTDP-4-dehydrorhamnose reductase [Roseovarius sp.]|uniref:dTDP-4-dehydrorhamnose reductase n=1 Tax=Roseovarius sp. TaxID=1486281 RepID=UPI0032EFF0C3